MKPKAAEGTLIDGNVVPLFSSPYSMAWATDALSVLTELCRFSKLDMLGIGESRKFDFRRKGQLKFEDFFFLEEVERRLSILAYPGGMIFRNSSSVCTLRWSKTLHDIYSNLQVSLTSGPPSDLWF